MALPKVDKPLPPALRGTVTAPEITIPLQQVAEDDVGHPEDYYRMIVEEYSNRYLAALGVTPTAQNKMMVVKNMPLKDCDIQASWASRSSSVADSLTILPPSRKKGHDSSKGGELGPKQRRQIEWLDVRPPQTEYYKRAESPSHADRVRKLEANLAERDMKISEGAHPSLTREFEKQRQMRMQEAQGNRKGEGAEEEAERKLRRNEALDTLKRFLLPFAAVQPGPGGTKVLKSWRDPELKLELDVPDGYKREAILPIQVSVQDLERETHAYVNTESGQLPLQALTTVPLHMEPYKTRKEQLYAGLRDRKQVRLIGLLAHFLYWTVLGYLHTGSRRLPEAHRQALFTAIHEVWSEIEELKHTPWGVSLGLPLHLLMLKRGVLFAFTTQYPNMMKDENVVRNLIFRMNVVLMRLLDPENRYSRLGIFDVSAEGIQLRRQLSLVEASQGWTTSQQTVAMLHRATTLTSSLLEAPLAHQTRRLLGKNVTTAILRNKDGPRSPTSSQEDLSQEWTKAMDAPHRVKLFNCARQRLLPVRAKAKE